MDHSSSCILVLKAVFPGSCQGWCANKCKLGPLVATGSNSGNIMLTLSLDGALIPIWIILLGFPESRLF